MLILSIKTILLTLVFFACLCTSVSGMFYFVLNKQKRIRNLIIFVFFSFVCIVLIHAINDSL